MMSGHVAKFHVWIGLDLSGFLIHAQIGNVDHKPIHTDRRDRPDFRILSIHGCQERKFGILHDLFCHLDESRITHLFISWLVHPDQSKGRITSSARPGSTCRLVATRMPFKIGKNNAFNQIGHGKILLTYGSLGQELLPGFLNVFSNAPLELSVGWEEDLIE